MERSKLKGQVLYPTNQVKGGFLEFDGGLFGEVTRLYRKFYRIEVSCLFKMPSNRARIFF